MSPWQWHVRLDGMVGLFCRIETTDGVVREGKITRTHTHPVKVNGEEFALPVGIELNSDASDVIEFRSMRTLVLS